MVVFNDLMELEDITRNMQGLDQLCHALKTAIYEGSDEVTDYENGFHLLDMMLYQECERLSKLQDELFDKAREHKSV